MMRGLFRLLLRGYPEPFRARYGPELVEAFNDGWGRARSAGWGPATRFALRTVVDTLVSALRERASVRGYRLAGGGVRLPARGIGILISDLWLDLRLAVRTLGSSPGYLTAVTLTLALGIGANTALFSAAWGVFGRELPFSQGNELVHVEAVRPEWTEGMPGQREFTFSVAELADLRSSEALEDVAEFHRMTFTLVGPGGPEVVTSAVVSSNYFEFLGMRPMLGRLFSTVEDHEGADPVIVLSHDYWTESFGADHGVVGRTVRVNGSEHRIVGVLPPIPQFPQATDIYLPISVCPTRSDPEFIEDRDARMMTAYARLEDGVTLGTAQQGLQRVTQALHQSHESYASVPGGWELEATPLREELVREARPVVWPLVGISLLLLLVACANAAGLALARANRRLGDLAVRAALGAGRGRLARQLLTEAVLLALLGGVVGVGVALVGSDLLATFAERFTTRAQEIRVDGAVLAFALGASLMSGVAFGLAPVMAVSGALRAVSRFVGVKGGRGGRRLQGGLVVVQVMIAMAVVSGAGLLMRSFWNANGASVGFDTRHVVAAEFADGGGRHPDGASFTSFLDTVRADLRGVHPFEEIARVPWTPLAVAHRHRDGLYLGDADERVEVVADSRAMDPEYFAVLGIGVLQGRLPARADTAGAPMIAVVNASFRDRYAPDRPILGLELNDCAPELECGPPVRIVGVVEDVRVNGVEYEVAPEVFRPLVQTDWFTGALIARVSGSPERALEDLIATARARDPDLAIRYSGTLEQFRQGTVAPRRFLAQLLGAFALVTAGLAFTGVFSLVALDAAARGREMSIRQALGASARTVERTLVRDGLRVVMLGSLGGLVLALVVGRLLRALLFEVGPLDPGVLIGSAALLLAGALGACIHPARRASRGEIRALLEE